MLETYMSDPEKFSRFDGLLREFISTVEGEGLQR